MEKKEDKLQLISNWVIDSSTLTRNKKRIINFFINNNLPVTPAIETFGLTTDHDDYYDTYTIVYSAKDHTLQFDVRTSSDLINDSHTRYYVASTNSWMTSLQSIIRKVIDNSSLCNNTHLDKQIENL